MYYDGAWGLKRAGDTSSSTEPIAGVSDEKLSSAAQTIMAKVDSGHPYKDASGKTQKLQSLYTDNFSCSVAKNEFNDDDETCSVNLDIASSVGVKSYKGTVEVDFSWQDNGWEISDCSAADGSYVPSYNNLIGTWTGTLTEAKGTTFNCYAGRENPVILTVKSVDVNSSTAVVDLSYTWHDHAKWAFTSDMNSYEGDTRVSKTDLVIDIKVGSSDYKIYDPDTGATVSLRIDKDGTVKMRVDTWTSWGGDGYISRSDQTDTYTMAKSSDAVA